LEQFTASIANPITDLRRNATLYQVNHQRAHHVGEIAARPDSFPRDLDAARGAFDQLFLFSSHLLRPPYWLCLYWPDFLSDIPKPRFLFAKVRACEVREKNRIASSREIGSDQGNVFSRMFACIPNTVVLHVLHVLPLPGKHRSNKVRSVTDCVICVH